MAITSSEVPTACLIETCASRTSEEGTKGKDRSDDHVPKQVPTQRDLSRRSQVAGYEHCHESGMDPYQATQPCPGRLANQRQDIYHAAHALHAKSHDRSATQNEGDANYRLHWHAEPPVSAHRFRPARFSLADFGVVCRAYSARIYQWVARAAAPNACQLHLVSGRSDSIARDTGENASSFCAGQPSSSGRRSVKHRCVKRMSACAHCAWVPAHRPGDACELKA